MNNRILRAAEELKKIEFDTCPCKTDVLLVEALHGYAESCGYRMEPALAQSDGTVLVEMKKSQTPIGDQNDFIWSQLEKIVGQPLGERVSTPVSSESVIDSLREISDLNLSESY